MRQLLICLFLILFVYQVLPAQQHESLAHQRFGVVKPTSPDTTNLRDMQQQRGISIAPTFTRSLYQLPSTTYVQSLGFFCRKELEIEKLTRLPLRFRLGSLAYTDKMEGKQGCR